MQRWLGIVVLIFLAVGGEMSREEAVKEIHKIDAETQKLNVEKEKHIELARKYQAEGDNWEYKTGRIQDAHEAWGKADDQRSQAIQYQLQIDHLLEKKYQIYTVYPELQYP